MNALMTGVSANLDDFVPAGSLDRLVVKETSFNSPAGKARPEQEGQGKAGQEPDQFHD